MKIKFSITTVLLIVILLLGGCSKNDALTIELSSTEKATVSGFLKALEQYDIQEMEKYIEVMPTSEGTIYLRDTFTDPYMIDIYQLANASMEYEIKGKSGDKVIIEMECIDIQSLYQNMMVNVMNMIFESGNITDETIEDINDELVLAYMCQEIVQGEPSILHETFELSFTEDGKIKTDDALKNIMTGNFAKSRSQKIEDISN